MLKILKLKLSIFLFSCISFASSIETQKPWLPNSEIDVKSYTLSLLVTDIDAGKLEANLKVVVMALKDTKKIQLNFDEKRMLIESIEYKNKKVEFNVSHGIKGEFNLSGDVLNIILPEKLSAKKIESFYIKYTINSNEADSSGNVVQEGFFHEKNFSNSNILSTRSWPYYARTWLPSNDHPSDIALFKVSVTVPKEFKVFSNGQMINGDYENGSGMVSENYRLYEWSQDTPISTYNMYIAIGELSLIQWNVCENINTTSCADENKITEGVFYYPKNAEASLLNEFKENIKNGSDSLIWFSQKVGKYAFKKLGFIFAPHPFAMENVTAITLPGPSAAVHEVAHHWWGNSVYIKHWGEFWISEGFAVYFNGLYKEATTGKNSSCSQTDGVLNNSADTDPMAIFDNVAYCKGAAALHDLRLEIAKLTGKESDMDGSREIFLKVMKNLYQDYKSKLLGSREMIIYLNKNLKNILLENNIIVTNSQVSDLVSQWKMKWFKY